MMWAWNGIAYHLVFFNTINPAAPLFAALFVSQAVFFAISAVTAKGLRFETGLNFRSISGFAVIVYAMLIYPVLGTLAGHGLMTGPMFGVAPCPTTIFTVGLLLLARGGLAMRLAIIPLLWSLIGFSAALQLAIPEDFGLGLAGLVLALVWRRALIDLWVRQGCCQLRRAERHTKSMISLVVLMSRLNRHRFRLAQRFRRDGPLVLIADVMGAWPARKPSTPAAGMVGP